MGGATSTTNNTIVIITNNNSAPNPPTSNFIDTLLGWANALVQGSPYPVTGNPDKDMITLQTAVKSVTEAAFLQQYAYGFNGPDTSPPNATNIVPTQPITDFTNCAQNAIAGINLYVDQSIYTANSQIPKWALTNMRSDLETFLQGIITQPVIDGWQVVPYSRYFTDPNGKVNLRVDAECLYTILPALDENNNVVDTLFLEFVGAYYSVAPTFRVAK